MRDKEMKLKFYKKNNILNEKYEDAKRQYSILNDKLRDMG